MVQVRLKGPQIGSSLGAVSARVGAVSESTQVTSFLKPSVVTGLPRIRDSFDNGTLSLDVTGLTGITAYAWRRVGGAAEGTGATLSAAGLGGEWIECAVTCDQGVLTAPPVMVYASMSMASHNADDAAVLALVPHAEATHIAVQSGDFSNPSTWRDGRVPRDGSFWLIPKDIVVHYDVTEDNVRMDRGRVDGTFQLDTARLTNEQLKMKIETLVCTRGSSLILGTAANPLPATASFELTISDRDYSQGEYMATDLGADNFLTTRGWGRGVLTQGLCRIWGNARTNWMFADEEVAAGATSVTMPQAPDWQVGEEILICATDGRITADNRELISQTEVREIASITNGGRTVNWTAPLVYDHGNPVPGSQRTDVRPIIALRGGRNITFTSEERTDPARKGHFACMHGMSTVDVWNMACVGMGRTDKSVPSGVIDASNDFKFYNGSTIATGTLTPRSNLQSRYAFHGHHLGWGGGQIMQGCYMEDSPGWGYVHHACRMAMNDCVGYRFTGAGMVSESADELGEWLDNVMIESTRRVPGGGNYTLNGKIQEGGFGTSGDTFRYGVGFGFRGRAMRTNRNYAVGCHTGHAFFPRGNNQVASSTGTMFDPRRSRLDLRTPGRLDSPAPYHLFERYDYPIIHHAGNGSFGCQHGLLVTKDGPVQHHDVNVKLKSFRVVGSRQDGALVEYVGTYILEDFDILAIGGNGIRVGGNTYQIVTHRARIEGANVAFFHDGGTDVLNAHDNFNNTTDPRWAHYGYDVIDCTSFDVYDVPAGATKTGPDVTIFEPDLDNTRIDYNADPQETFALKWADYTAATITVSNRLVNGDGTKSDNISASSDIEPKPWYDRLFSSNSARYATFQYYEGHWQYGGQNVMVIPNFVSDRVTGRPHKFIKMVHYTDTPGGTNNGAYAYTDTPVVQSDITRTVAAGGSVVIDFAAGATGGTGSFEVDEKDHIAPQNGHVTIDGAAGTITYTPDDAVREGTDEFYAFVVSDGQYKTVRADILIGSGDAPTAPVADVNFSVTDGAGLSVDVTLNDAPGMGGRKILVTQYSTDAGATWRRLCNGWKPGIHTIGTESDGTAITAGSVNLRLRCLTDYDRNASPASADGTVTVAP